jgi:hypothetical protein
MHSEQWKWGDISQKWEKGTPKSQEKIQQTQQIICNEYIAITRESKQSWNIYKEYLYCNDETVIKSESSFEARTNYKTLDSIVLEVGTIPYDARPELTQKISNHIGIKEDKSILKKKKLESPVNHILIMKIFQTMQNLSCIDRYLGILKSVPLI